MVDVAEDVDEDVDERVAGGGVDERVADEGVDEGVDERVAERAETGRGRASCDGCGRDWADACGAARSGESTAIAWITTNAGPAGAVEIVLGGP